MQVMEEGPESLIAYGEVPIRFEATERLDLAEPTRVKGVPMAPLTKDYDSDPEYRPRALSERFDLTNWGILAAFEGDERLGGTIIAYRTPEVEMLEWRNELAVVWDFRVRPEQRGRGVGRALWTAAEEWARSRGATELRVETQDINLPACRFYAAMGCRPLRVTPGAYPELPDEVQILWTKPL